MKMIALITMLRMLWRTAAEFHTQLLAMRYIHWLSISRNKVLSTSRLFCCIAYAGEQHAAVGCGWRKRGNQSSTAFIVVPLPNDARGFFGEHWRTWTSLSAIRLTQLSLSFITQAWKSLVTAHQTWLFFPKPSLSPSLHPSLSLFLSFSYPWEPLVATRSHHCPSPFHSRLKSLMHCLDRRFHSLLPHRLWQPLFVTQ